MSNNSSVKIDLEHLAEEYLARIRRDERPSLEEYAERFPALADEIRQFFPTLHLLERFKPDSQDDSLPRPTSGDFGTTSEGPPVSKLGDFRIVREIGRGGMGIVYEAVQESLGRQVALKVLMGNTLADPARVQRFVREARAAARLHHTNIVPVFGIGDAEGLNYYAMQFINGQGLDRVLDELQHIRAIFPGRVAELPRPTDRNDHESGNKKCEEFVVATRHFTQANEIADSLWTGRFSVGVDPELTDLSAASTPALATEVLTQNSKSERRSDSTASECAKADTDIYESPTTATFVLPGSGNEPSQAGQPISVYWSSVARMGAQAADALQHAHDNGILHRDIKPSNLLLDTRGTLWVADFGLAKSVDQDNLTRTGDIVGTLRYMAPEVFDGKPDARSDIYSLGLTLYELIAFRPGFDAIDRQLLIRQVMHESPARLQTIEKNLPRDLVTIVHKAIDRDPGARYQKASDLADDLRRFLGDQPIKARRQSLVARARRWCRKNPGIATLTTASALLLFTIAIGGTIWAINARMARREIAQAEEDATHRQYDARVAQANASRWSRRPGQRLNSLSALKEAASLIPRLGYGPEERLRLRNEAIAAMGLVDLEERETFSFQIQDSFVAFDPRLERYALADESAQLSVFRLSDRQAISQLPVSQPLTGNTPRKFTSDGKFLVGMDPMRKIWVWNINESRFALPPSIATTTWQLSPGSFSSQGQLLARVSRDLTIQFFDMEMERSVASAQLRGQTVSLSPDGKKIALVTPSGTDVQIWDWRSGRIEQQFAGKGAGLIEWSPDGRLIAFEIDERKRIEVWNATTGKQCAQLNGHRNGGLNFRFSPDSSLLASASWDASARLWDPLSGRELLRTTGGRCVFRGDTLVSSMSSEIHFWRMTPSAECLTLRAADDQFGLIFRDCAFWPDTSLAVIAREDGIRIWNFRTNKEVAFAQIEEATSVLVHKPSKSIISSSTGGIYQWPITASEDGNRCMIGPPRRLLTRVHGHKSGSVLAQSADGVRLAAVVDYDAAASFEIGSGPNHQTSIEHKNLCSLAITPDGKHVVSGTNFGKGIRVWNAGSGELVQELWPECVSAEVAISPDGKLLAACETRDLKIYSTEDWRLLRTFTRSRLGRRLTWSPDSRTIVLAEGSMAKILDSTTGNEIATILSPNDAGNIESICFSEDGGRLAVTYCFAVEMWDLRLVRGRLAEMKLDWDEPPLPEVKPEKALPDEVAFDLGELAPDRSKEIPDAVARLNVWNQFEKLLMGRKWREAIALADQQITRDPTNANLWRGRGKAYLGLQQLEKALADFRKYVDLHPADAVALNDIAWSLVASPRTNEEATTQAIAWASRAVEKDSTIGNYQNTLGIAYYRAENWAEAIRWLKLALKTSANKYVSDSAFFLAMACWKSNKQDEARKWYVDAVEWMQMYMPTDTQLVKYRNEASAVLGPQEVRRLGVELYSRAIRRNDKDANAYFLRGRYYSDILDYRNAVDDLTRAVELDPNLAEAHHYLGHAHGYLFNNKEAVKYFTNADRLKPNDAHLIDMKAWYLFLSIDFERAAVEWERSLSLKSEQLRPTRSLALIYVLGPEKLRDAKKALSLAQRAIALGKKDPEALNTLGIVHYRMEQFNEAAKALEQAATGWKNKTPATNRFFLAMALHRLGESDKAKKAFDSAVDWRKTQQQLSPLQEYLFTQAKAEAEIILSK